MSLFKSKAKIYKEEKQATAAKEYLEKRKEQFKKAGAEEKRQDAARSAEIRAAKEKLQAKKGIITRDSR